MFDDPAPSPYQTPLGDASHNASSDDDGWPAPRRLPNLSQKEHILSHIDRSKRRAQFEDATREFLSRRLKTGVPWTGCPGMQNTAVQQSAEHQFGCVGNESSSDEDLPTPNDGQRARRKGLRPSSIVVDLDAGSGPDAGVLEEDRAKQRNKLRSSFLRLVAVDETGETRPFLEYQRFFPAISGYDRYLKDPPEEASWSPFRTPENFLSYGLPKRILIPGDARLLTSQSRSEHTQPIGETHKRRIAPNASLSDDNRQFNSENRPFASINPSEASGESHPPYADLMSTDELDSSLQGEDITHSDSDNVVDLIDTQSEDLLSAMLSRVEESPQSFLRGHLAVAISEKNEAMPCPSSVNSADSSVQAGASAMSKHPDLIKPNLKICSVCSRVHHQKGPSSSAFYCQLALALSFAGGYKNQRLERSEALEKLLNRSQNSGQGDRNQFGLFENHTKSFGSRMLKKMGFTGRLGASAQGISNPLKGIKMIGRFGLGLADDKDKYRFRKRPHEADPSLSSRIFPTSSLKKARTNGVVSNALRGQANNPINAANNWTRGGGHVNRALSGKSNGPSLLQEDEDWRIEKHGNAPVPNPRLRGSQKLALLDDDDEYETDDPESLNYPFDTGRRGILVESDVLFLGSHGRRLRAFSHALRKYLPLAEAIVPFNSDHDVSDAEAAQDVLRANNIEITDDNMQAFLDKLEEGYKMQPNPVPNANVIAELRAVSSRYQLGILHRGTLTRLNRELHQTNLRDAFIRIAKVDVKCSDSSPYCCSWRELMCRLGVSASQCLLVGSDHGMASIPSFLVAARELGARSAVCVCTQGSISRVENVETLFDSHLTVTDRTFSTGFDVANLLTMRNPLPKVRRVLAWYGREALWYAARELFRSECDRNSTKPILVEYHHSKVREWASSENVIPLIRRDFRRMQTANFPGLLDRYDVVDIL